MALLTGLDPQRIAFAGDWHGNTPWARAMIRAAKRNGADVIVHTGDFGFKFAKNYMHMLRHELEDLGLELYFVDGNHDDHPQLQKRWTLDEGGFGTPPYGSGDNRIHYIPRGHRWVWNGKTYMGLGGAISVDRSGRTIYSTYWPEEAITYSQFEYAMRDGKVDVMIAHDMPESAELPNLRKSEGWPEDVLYESKLNREGIQAVVEQVQPTLYVHGHFHQAHYQKIGQMHVISLAQDGTTHNQNMVYFDDSEKSLKQVEPAYGPHYEDFYENLEVPRLPGEPRRPRRIALKPAIDDDF